MNFELKIAEIISNAVDIDFDDILSLIEVPSNTDMGDYSFPCFKLSKQFKKAPVIIANEILEKMKKPDFIDKIEVINAYINFYISKDIFVSEVLKEVYEKKELFGSSNIGYGKNVVIDYSSPNIAKPFHVGHLRSTVIGNSLYNIFKILGYNSIGVNHLGDWGTQFGKMIVAYKKWGDKDLIEKNGVKELTKIYVKFHEEADQDDNLNEEARSWFVKMQNGEKEALTLWKWFYDISMDELNRIYNKLDIKFDYFTGESFYNDKMSTVVDELKEKKLLIKSQGAMVVDLEKYNMAPCLILRSDGGTLYPTRDIAAAFYRKKEFNFDKALYLTALDQNLHFSQWFKVIDLMGYEWAKDLVYIPFGLVNLDSGKLSTRSGHVILMEEILDEAVAKTKEIIEEKNPNIEDKENIAEQVGIGAVIFSDLYNSRIKDVTFSWDRMLNFDGETAPYIQYTHARACSILKKANISCINAEINFSLITDDISIEICKLLSQYPEKIIEASNKYEPYIIARHIVDISQAFNKFYHDNSILKSEQDLKEARLLIVYAVKTIIQSGLKLLGIKAPEQM